MTIAVRDVVLRDAHQSVRHTRLRLDDHTAHCCCADGGAAD